MKEMKESVCDKMKTKEQWIQSLELLPHPEGGFFKQTEKSDTAYLQNGVERSLYTSIYFLLTKDSPSHFHQLTADECWFYHDGEPLSVHCIFPDGRYQVIKIGKDIENGEQLHYVVPAGTIFGSTVEEGYALVSCAVIPGFEFDDFRLFNQAELLEKFPQHASIIQQLAYQEIPQGKN